MSELLRGEKCPYCGSKTDYIDSSVVYSRSYGMIYACIPCKAWVGVHKGTNNALGRLANSNLRELKKQAHSAFDSLWKTGIINKIYPVYIKGLSNRKKAYKWLSVQMNIPFEFCHIGYFDDNQCKDVISICESVKKTNNGHTIMV